MVAQPVRVRDRVREEALNVALANLLRKQGLQALGEARVMSATGLRLPDVLIRLNGIRIILEGRFSRRDLEADCRRRLEEGLAEVSVAIVYPDVSVPWEEWHEGGVEAYLRTATFEAKMLRLSGEDSGIAETRWRSLRVEELLEHLEAAWRSLVGEDFVAEAVRTLRVGIDAAARSLLDLGQPSVRAESIGEVLQIPPSRKDTAGDRTETLTKMAVLALIDAAVFHEVLTVNCPDLGIPTLLGLDSPLQDELYDAWTAVLDVDYGSVFRVSLEILRLLPASTHVEDALESITSTARSLAASRTLLRHDLMGRVYHTLLMRDIAKYYATYYTSVPTATLLAHLGLNLDNPSWNVNWEDVEGIAGFRGGDLACGSGTLLSALYRVITHRHIQDAFCEGIEPRPSEVHGVLLDEALWGFDVLTYAAHLAATSLALHNPAATFERGNIYVVPLGIIEGEKHLGSLDFFKGRKGTPLQLSQTGLATRVSVEEAAPEQVELPDFDLVIMNPPFTRSVGKNLLFGDLPQDERSILQAERLRILREHDLSGVGTAGLAADFAALATQYLREGGRLCLVIPRSLLSGVSWNPVRAKLAAEYDIEAIVASHEAPDGWNFSENTSLSEVLVVARKKTEEEELPGMIVNLWRRPRNEWEALSLAHYLTTYQKTLREGPYNILENASASALPLQLGLGSAGLWDKVGEAYCVSQEVFAGTLESWGQLAPLAQGALNRSVFFYLSQHRLHVPGVGMVSGRLPLTTWGREPIGPDRRQIYGTLSEGGGPSPYRALWGTNSEAMDQLDSSPNSWLLVEPGEGERARALWQQASHLMVVERWRLNTYRMTAVYLDQAALSNVWWPVQLQGGQTCDGESFSRDEAERIQALWLNTTPGVLGLLGLRQDTEGAWVALKKGTWASSVPVLDLARLERGQIEALLDVFEELRKERFAPLPQEFAQAGEGKGTRVQLDGLVMEAVLGEAPDLTPLYMMLSREPILCLEPLVPVARRQLALL